MATDPYRYFRIEARELLDQLARGLLALEREDSEAAAATVALLLRLAHTFKGAARVVRLPQLAEGAHALEELLSPLREPGSQPEPGRIEALLAQLDALESGLAALAAPTATSPPAAQPALPLAQPPAPRLEALRPPSEALDALLAGVDQSHLQLQPLQQALQLARASRAALGLGEPEVQGLLLRLERQLETGLTRLEHELQGLREQAEQLRLLPAEALFAPLERAARDAACEQGKALRFVARGGALRLEAELLDGLRPALLQLVRNALAHGIESPAKRQAAGKPAEGELRLEVERCGRQVRFVCSDDGAGLDLPALRQAARAKGWPEAEGEEAALLQRLLQGGLSTAARVDGLAGRGVGLDLVRDAAARLGARLSLSHEPGRGTRVELLAPLRLAALDTLLVEAGGRRLHLPLQAVQRVLPASALGENGLSHEDQLLPYADLAQALDPGAAPGPLGSVVLLAVGDQRAALGVERLGGAACVLLRPAPVLHPDSPLVAGVTLDANQHPRLVLDPAALLAHAQACRGRPQRPPAATPAPLVLVVDDSLTTRMLEQSILESAGYRVDLAVSAEQALAAAQRQRYDLFLVDVEMPGMDGFGFIERTRADPQLREVPAILLSSRDAPEDKRRGQAVGASAYIVKSEFAQQDFLRQVRALAGAPA